MRRILGRLPGEHGPHLAVKLHAFGFHAVELALARRGAPQAFLGVLMTFVLGLVVLYMLKSLPYLGAVIGLFGWFAGAGALILNMLAGQRMMPAQEPPPIPGGGDGKK